MHRAVYEMARREPLPGYWPKQGYDLLRNAIAEKDNKAYGRRYRRTQCGSIPTRRGIRPTVVITAPTRARSYSPGRSKAQARVCGRHEFSKRPEGP
jgi:hypothetical protein